MATASEIKTFIQTLGRLAVAESNRRIAAGKGFVLPSVCIAQSAIETGWGTAGIMVRANAYFGIKAGGSWTGAVYRADTWEVDSNGAYNTTANFRAYGSKEESVADYYNLIGNNARYSKALSFGKDRTAWKTAKECITAIWAGGYATDTLYVEKIMNTINARNLTEYDNLVTGEGEAPIADNSVSFDLSSLVQGSLIVTDNGRSIQNDRTDKKAVAIEWDKAYTATNNTRFTLDIPNEAYTGSVAQIYVARLIGDTASISPAMLNGQSIDVVAGEKIGVFFRSMDGSDITPDDIEKNFTFTFKSLYPDGEERYTTPIAAFVKVE